MLSYNKDDFVFTAFFSTVFVETKKEFLRKKKALTEVNQK